jgi:hypothetical protein
MMDEHMDDILRELQAQLTVEPSPEFAAGVRARARHDDARSAWIAWRPMLAVAASAVLLAGVWMARGRDRAPAAGSGAAAATEAARLPQPAAPTGASTPAPTGVSHAAPAARGPRRAVRAADREVTDLEVIVPADQRVALRQLLVAVREGRASVPGAPSTVDEVTGELKPLVAIDVPPIVVEPLPVSARSGGGR